MKNRLFWISKYFAVGLLIFTMLFAIGCSGSGDNRNPFANNEYNDDSNHSNGSNLSGVLALMGGLLGNNDFTTTPAGSLDTSFGTNGTVTTTINMNDYVNALGIQSDGKIVAAGTYLTSSSADFVLARYKSDGTLDTSFGSNGTVTTSIGYWDIAHALGIQSDGKIVVAGRSDIGSNSDFALVRYTSNGTLDTTFGGTGTVTTDIGTSSVDNAQALGIQSDGKIVLAGDSWSGGDHYFALARYNSNGTLDTSFGGTGIVTTTIGSSGDAYATALVIQPDGKIVAAGYYYNGSSNDFVLVRYTSNGTLDTTFGGTGIVTTDIGGIDNYVEALAIQFDGKIVAAGYSQDSSDYFVLARYKSDGTLDTSFGSNGTVTTSIGSSGSDDEVYGLGIQSDGKIVAAGYSGTGTSYDFALARYNTDGTLDSSFGTNGIVTTDIGAGQDLAYALAIQSDGKIVAGGSSNNGSNLDFALARYRPSLTIENLW